MHVMADNDVIGQVALLRRILESDEWRRYAAYLQIDFIEFKSLNLAPQAPDQKVWQACQDAGVILITGNRAGGRHSLDGQLKSTRTQTACR